jgi:tetratricopeptide (TPR) repeat protein
LGDSKVNKLFQLTVITWIVFHVSWVLFSFNAPLLESVALALVAVGFWAFFGLLLLRRIRFIRFLLMLAVIGRIVFLWGETDVWMSDYHDFGAMASNPATSWAMNVSLLLDGVLLVMAYLTPVARGFEARKASPETKIGRVVAAATRSDGAMITIPTAILLVVFVVNEFVISARYAEDSPHTLVSRASEYLESARATGDRAEIRFAYFELGDAYWLLHEREQAAPMYEEVVALTPEDPDFSDWILSRSISRLLQYYVTESDARFGDGSHALAMAQRVQDDARDAAYFETLAAVYARLGEIETAIHHQKTAVEKCAAAGCCQDYWVYAYRLEEYTGISQWQ